MKVGSTMKITYASKQNDLPSEFIPYAEKKLKKFDRLFEDASAQIRLSSKKDCEKVELTISSGGTLYRSEKKGDSMHGALDDAVDAILRQIRKNKTRLEKRLKSGAFKEVSEETVMESEEIPEFNVRTKRFPVKPMKVEDAILQMLLLEHDFFLFDDPDTGELNVVYRKADGSYGRIIPE